MSGFRSLFATLTICLVVVMASAPAIAHEGEESGKAAELVLQAIALLVNQPDDVEAIRDKIEDAGRAEDPSGVDLALVAEAGAALDSGDLHEARALLEQSIGAQPHINASEPPAIRETTPTTTARSAAPVRDFIAEPLDVRSGLDGGDWALLAGSLVVGLLGIWLGVRYRPTHGDVA